MSLFSTAPPLFYSILQSNEEEIIAELEGTTQKEEITPDLRGELPLPPNPPSLKQVNKDAARGAEARIIMKALEMTHFNHKQAARLLNVSYRILLYKIKECRIQTHLHSKDP